MRQNQHIALIKLQTYRDRTTIKLGAVGALGGKLYDLTAVISRSLVGRLGPLEEIVRGVLPASATTTAA